MLLFTDADAHALVEKNLGEEGVREVTEAFGGRFLPFTEVEGAVERDVEWLRGSKAIKKETKISGWVYEVETGKVKRVV
jgi:carbonic anhydrase